ncbi:hypothetical protein, conserved [Leishmania tarentolae]|uniref:Uncharacterized protein n=1 Tax=Leishmania tarentolae TaxID=5689 RepID=A0A640KJX7_LEITA|nr:hypothetical protein, conserved [Leishmania tarentolae]
MRGWKEEEGGDRAVELSTSAHPFDVESTSEPPAPPLPLSLKRNVLAALRMVLLCSPCTPICTIAPLFPHASVSLQNSHLAFASLISRGVAIVSLGASTSRFSSGDFWIRICTHRRLAFTEGFHLMSASPLPTRGSLHVSPAQEVLELRCSFMPTPKAAADSTIEEGAGASSEYEAATAGVSEAGAFEVSVKPAVHHERRRRRCCSEASGPLQTARSERSSCARQDSVTETDGSAIAPATDIETQGITDWAAGRESWHSGAERTTMTALLEHQVQGALPHSSYGCVENTSVPTLTANTVNSIRCTEAPPTAVVTMWVPTQFTTAAGRPICLRERRLVTAESPYWKLLRFDPAREAIVVPPDSSADGCNHEKDAVLADSGYPSSPISTAKQVAEQCSINTVAALGSAIADPCYESAVSAASPLTSTYAGYAYVHRCVRRRRATSCPERVIGSWSSFSMRSEAGYSLPPFSGFCAADGRPFYCHSSSASAEGQDRH